MDPSSGTALMMEISRVMGELVKTGRYRIFSSVVFTLGRPDLKMDTLQWHSQSAERLRTSKGDYNIQQWLSSIAFLFKMGNALKGKNLLPG